MSEILKQLEPFLLDHSKALRVVAQTEGWDAISPFHERELAEIVQLEPGAVSEIAAHVRGIAWDKLTLDDLQLPATSSEDPFVDDDIAMSLRFGIPFADRNPLISYWAFATLLSLQSAKYHEAKNYWLSAAASVVNISRKRSWFVRRAILTVLSSGVGSPTDDSPSVVLLPTYEIVREMQEEASCLGVASRALEPSADLAPLLKSSLRLAVEANAAQIARAAFPLLGCSMELPGDSFLSPLPP